MGLITTENAGIVEAWATVAATAVGLIAALLVLVQLGMIRKDSRERTRPYVEVDVVPGMHGIGAWDLVIVNRGASTALKVCIDSAGELVPQDDKDHIVPALAEYLPRPMTLIPGARRRVMWAYQGERIQAGVLEPRDLTLTYEDDRGSCYSDTFHVGDELLNAAAPAPYEGATSGSDALKNINHALRALNVHVGEMRR